jgi:hypothetical protein
MTTHLFESSQPSLLFIEKEAERIIDQVKANNDKRIKLDQCFLTNIKQLQSLNATLCKKYNVELYAIPCDKMTCNFKCWQAKKLSLSPCLHNALFGSIPCCEFVAVLKCPGKTTLQLLPTAPPTNS